MEVNTSINRKKTKKELKVIITGKKRDGDTAGDYSMITLVMC